MAECEWAVMCDYAFQDVGRKTCLIGIFDRIFTQAVPAQHHQAAFAFKVTGDPNEEVAFKMEITRPSGGTLGAIGGKIRIPPAGTVDVIANLQGMPLPDFGAYAFSLYFGEPPVPAKTIGVTVAKSPLPVENPGAPPQ